ncbi:unnamed protein product, partial [Phaeothamnion confervicola]
VEHAAVDSASGLLSALLGGPWDVILCDQSMPGFSAAAALSLARELRPDVPFIVVSGEISLNLAVSLIRAGARDFVRKDELARLGPVIERELLDARSRRERAIAEAHLQESRDLFQAIVENVGDLVAVLDDKGRRIYNNPSYGPLFREEDIRAGSNSFLEVHPDDRERLNEVFRRTVATGTGERAEFRFVLKDGNIRHMESDGRAIRGADGRVSKVVVVSRDITALKTLEAELRELAAMDPLTGLPNRRHFLSRLEQESARINRLQGHRAAVLMLDSDHFKRINDAYGHAAGDQVLAHIARLLSRELRKVDVAGRIGGEEFAIILPGADLVSAEAFAERLRMRIASNPSSQGGTVLPMTVSIGVAGMDAADAMAADALARADRALYRAKAQGRNRVVVDG